MNPSTTSPIPISWRHRLLIRYYRAREHPAKLRLLGWLKRLLAIGPVRVEVIPGVIMDLDENDFVHREIITKGGYELATLKLFDRLVAEARGFLDIGGHHGQYTLRAARALNTCGGRAFAFEPMPANAAALLHNAALSGLTNINLCTVALSDAPGISRMVQSHDTNSGGAHLDTKATPNSTGLTIHVAVRPFPDVVALMPPTTYDLVKIDVEGHEFPVLRSLIAAAPRLPRNILFEYRAADFDYGPVATTLDWLRSLGYELRSIDGVSYTTPRPLPDDNLWAHHTAS